MQKKFVFIFDFDGTFYTADNVVFSKVSSHVQKYKRKILGRLSDKEYKQIENENPIWKTVYEGSEIINVIYDLKSKYPSFKISAKDFWDFQNEYPDPLIIDKNRTTDASYIKQLCKNYPCYIVSNSSPNHIKFYLNELGMNHKWFKKIISNRFTLKDRSKKHYYEKILEKEDCKPSDAFVFGDSIRNDLNPAKEIGINTYLITDATLIPSIIDKILID